MNIPAIPNSFRALALAWSFLVATQDTNAQTMNLYNNVEVAKIRYISADEAKQNNVAHMVVKIRWQIVWVCHFGKIHMEVQSKSETLIWTAWHCIDPKGYLNPSWTVNDRKIDYILARSLTKLFKPQSGITVETTDTPEKLERSELYGESLHKLPTHMYACLPHWKEKMVSTCFYLEWKSYMDNGVNGKATIYVDRSNYIELLRRAERSCEDAVISGVSGNNVRDSNKKVVWFISTAVEACGILYKEKVLNNLGISVKVNAFPITYEPIRHSQNSGMTSIILN
jgi:hypothetical protein